MKAWKYLRNNETRNIGFGGAGNGGKSWLGGTWLMLMCYAYPGTSWLMGRKELENIKKTTLKTFYKVCRSYGFKIGVHFNYNDKSHIVRWFNGSEILLYDLRYMPSDPLYTDLGSLELTGAFIDESNEVPITAINIVKTRVGRQLNKEYGIFPKVFETFNPDKGHVYRRFWKPYKESTMPAGRIFIRSLPSDNPEATEDWKQQVLDTNDKITIQRLLHGNFEYEDDPNAMINRDAIIDMFTNAVDPSKDKYAVVDVARFGRDKTVVHLWKGYENYKIIEWKKQGIDVTQTKLKTLLAEERIPYSHCVADEEGVGGGLIDNMRGIKGFIANSTPLPVPKSQKLKDNFRSLKDQCAYKLADMINEHKLSIRCEDETLRETIIEEVEQIKADGIDKERKKRIIPKDKVKEIIGRSPDHGDALIMRMYFEFDKFLVDDVEDYVQPEYRGPLAAPGGPTTLEEAESGGSDYVQEDYNSTF